METRQNDIEALANKLFAQIDKKNKILPFFVLSDNELLRKQCRAIYSLKAIIIKSIQIGNLKKALIYLFVINDILSKIEMEERNIRYKVSQYILEEKKVK